MQTTGPGYGGQATPQIAQAAPPQLDVLILPDLDEDAENAVMLEVVEELGREIRDSIVALYEERLLVLGIKLKGKQRLAWFLQKMASSFVAGQDVMGMPVYDAQAAQQELTWLLNPDYFDLLKLGQAPAPVSMPWAALLGIGPLFRVVQADFRDLYRQYGRAA